MCDCLNDLPVYHNLTNYICKLKSFNSADGSIIHAILLIYVKHSWALREDCVKPISSPTKKGRKPFSTTC